MRSVFATLMICSTLFSSPLTCIKPDTDIVDIDKADKYNEKLPVFTSSKKSGFYRNGEEIYYYGKSGKRVTGQQVINGIEYLFDDQGVLQTGAIGSYFFDAAGKRIKNSWAGDHYYGPDGKYVTGTQVIDGKTYTFDENGALVYSLVVPERVLWVGDSRTVQLENASRTMGIWDDDLDIGYSATDYEIAKGAMGYDYMVSRSLPWVDDHYQAGDTIVINYGVNDMGGSIANMPSLAQKYADVINEHARKWEGCTVVYMSVNPNGPNATVSNEKVKAFNEAIKPLLDSQIRYIDTYTDIYNSDYFEKELDEMQVHYSNVFDGNFNIYRMIYQKIRNGF